MTFKIYGESDEDTTAERLLLEVVEQRRKEGKQTMHVLLHQRKPIYASTCQGPGSLTVQAVMADRTVVTVRQDRKGGPARVLN